MDYDREDRWASRGVAVATLHGTRFFLTATGCGTDVPDNAKVFRSLADAQQACDAANIDPAWGELRGKWEALIPYLAFPLDDAPRSGA